MIANDDRGDCREVLAAYVDDLFVPALFSCGCVERDDIPVRRFQIEPVAVHAEAAVADVVAAFRAPEEMPDLPS